MEVSNLYDRKKRRLLSVEAEKLAPWRHCQGAALKPGNRTYLDEDHGGDLLGGEGLLLAEVLNLDFGAAVVINDGEGPRLDVLLDGGVVETTADQTPE